METATPDASPDRSDRHRRRRVYEDRWGATRRIVQLRPHLWREIGPETDGGRVLEIGPGLRPTSPVRGSYFVETSERATHALSAAGGHAIRVGGWRLPFRDDAFRTVLALEILEHLEEDERLLSEIVRVLQPGGVAVISVPLHMERWTAIDDSVGHVRRYEPEDLLAKIEAAGLRAERFHARPSGSHPVIARLGIALQSGLPRFTNWFLQRVIFRVASAWQRSFGKLRWKAIAEPVPGRAGGMLVVARAPGGG